MNTELVQGIFNLVVVGIQSDWKSIIFNYKIDDSRSGYSGSYEDPHGEEKYFKPSLLSSTQMGDLENLLESLHKETTEIGKEPFTHCTLHFTSDGDFKVEYKYDPVDWSVKVR